MSHHSLDVSFAEQQFLILMNPVYPVFYFMDSGFGVMSKNSLFHFLSKYFLLCFLVEVVQLFLCVCFTFRSIIRFVTLL